MHTLLSDFPIESTSEKQQSIVREIQELEDQRMGRAQFDARNRSLSLFYSLFLLET